MRFPTKERVDLWQIFKCDKQKDEYKEATTKRDPLTQKKKEYELPKNIKRRFVKMI